MFCSLQNYRKNCLALHCADSTEVREITWSRKFYLVYHIMLKWYIRSGETWVGSMNIYCKPATQNSILEWTIQLLISKSTADTNLLTFWTQEGQRLRVCTERLLCVEHTDKEFISERKWSTAETGRPTTGVGHWLQKNSEGALLERYKRLPLGWPTEEWKSTKNLRWIEKHRSCVEGSCLFVFLFELWV